jgi:hypothetical protein
MISLIYSPLARVRAARAWDADFFGRNLEKVPASAAIRRTCGSFEFRAAASLAAGIF